METMDGGSVQGTVLFDTALSETTVRDSER